MARFKVQMPSPKFYRGWGFVALLGIVLTVLVFLSRGGAQTVQAGLDDPEGCRVTVSVADVNVRTRPDGNAPVAEVLRRDDLRPATRNVQNGYRQLADERWAASQFLTPLIGSKC